MSLPATDTSSERTPSAQLEGRKLHSSINYRTKPFNSHRMICSIIYSCRGVARRLLLQTSRQRFLILFSHRTKSRYDSGVMCALVLNASSSPLSLCCWIALTICCTPLSLFLTSLTVLPIIKQRIEPLHLVFSLKVKHALSDPSTLHIFCIWGQNDAVCRTDIADASLDLDSCVYCTSYPASFSTANIVQIYQVSCLNSRQLLIRPLDGRHCFGNKRIQSVPDAVRNLSNSHVHHFVLTLKLFFC